MSIFKYLTLSHLQKVLSALEVRFQGLDSKINSIPQSDWNENDSADKGYIKNRTHWKEQTYISDNIIINNFSMSAESQEIIEIGKTYSYTLDCDSDYWSHYCNNYTFSDIDINNPMAIITTNDTEENLVGLYIVNNENEKEEKIFYYNDNFCIIIDQYSGDTKIYIFTNFYLDSSFLSFKIKLKNKNTVYHTLDNKYLNGILIKKGVGTNSEIFNDENNIAVGSYSHAEGHDTKAYGASSHAEGASTQTNGYNSHAEGFSTYADNDYSHAEGYCTYTYGVGSHAEGYETIADGQGSHAEGGYTKAKGDYSHTEGFHLQITIRLTGEANATTYIVNHTMPTVPLESLVGLQVGNKTITGCSRESNIDYITLNETLSTRAISLRSYSMVISTTASGVSSHAEGQATIAKGDAAHAEGQATIAEGSYSHAEGQGTAALSGFSHAEGTMTIASGIVSHAEGNGTVASGPYSHTEGILTIANHRAQHVFGEYNIADDSSAENGERGNYIEIVGNGNAPSDKSNARTLDWSGNEILAGKLTIGTGPINDMDVATKQYVDTAAAAVSVSCATVSEIEEMCGVLGLRSIVIDTSDYEVGE